MYSSKLYWTILNCIILNYTLIQASGVAGWVSFSAFTSLLVIPIEIWTSAIGLKFFVITAGNKKYQLIIKKKKKKMIK